MTIQDYFIGGTETTRTTLMWAFIYLMNDLDVLQNVHSEIDDVIGPHRPPSWRDRQNMPYTEAVITEVLRIRPMALFALPHVTTEGIEVCGARIPEGTKLLASLYTTSTMIHISGNTLGILILKGF